MKAIVRHDMSGHIKSVAFVADNVGYEPEPEEQVLEIDTRDIDSGLDWHGLNKQRFQECAKRIVEDFRVAQGRVVKR